MSRPLRLEFPGAIWHVTSRGNERRDIYRDDRDRRSFLALLAAVVAQRRWILHAYVLMRNHYHLLVETPETNLSRGVRTLSGDYAQSFNRRYRRAGHLFQGRFKGILVERESHLLELVRYVVLNPVRCHAVLTAGEYEWSSYRATAGLRRPEPWLEIAWTLGRFHASSIELAYEPYRRFVADGRGARYNPWEQLVGQIYLGGEAFCDRMQSLAASEPRHREIAKAQRYFVRPSFGAAITLIVDVFSESEKTLRSKSRRPGRKAVALIGALDCGLPHAPIGEWLGCTDWAVSKLVRVAQELQRSDRSFRERIEAVRRQLPQIASTLR